MRPAPVPSSAVAEVIADRDIHQARARSASCVPVVSRKRRHADPLPASRACELPTGLLCTTMWITCVEKAPGLCAPREILGIPLPGDARNRAFTWDNAVEALCIEKEPKLSTRRAAIAYK
jgi:hypothetical protein